MDYPQVLKTGNLLILQYVSYAPNAPLANRWYKIGTNTLQHPRLVCDPVAPVSNWNGVAVGAAARIAGVGQARRCGGD